VPCVPASLLAVISGEIQGGWKLHLYELVGYAKWYEVHGNIYIGARLLRYSIDARFADII
jgi:hypothetical protein